MPSSDVTPCCHLGVRCRGLIITAQHWALSAVDTASPLAYCLAAHPWWRTVELFHMDGLQSLFCWMWRGEQRGKSLLIHSISCCCSCTQGNLASLPEGGAGGNRKWTLSAALSLEMPQGEDDRSLGPVGSVSCCPVNPHFVVRLLICSARQMLSQSTAHPVITFATSLHPLWPLLSLLFGTVWWVLFDSAAQSGPVTHRHPSRRGRVAGGDGGVMGGETGNDLTQLGACHRSAGIPQTRLSSHFIHTVG